MTSTDNAQAAAVAAARTAGFAPSIHNSQPWHWQVTPDTLHLRADRSRQLGVTDPGGRLLTISCGAALNHALVALAAQAWPAEVRLAPDPADPDLLASVRLGQRVDVEPSRMRELQLLRIRHTDRRPVAEVPVPEAAADELARVAEGEGARLHWLRPDDVIELAGAADHAQRVESVDPEWRTELGYWTGKGTAAGLGVPDATIPAQPPATTVPARDFGHPGSLPIEDGHDSYARYAILYGDEDTTEGWLCGGQALSAVWLHAIEQGLSVVPLSAVVEVPETRQALRGMLAGVGEPYLVLRVGVAPDDTAGPEHTPRLPAEQVIDIIA